MSNQYLLFLWLLLSIVICFSYALRPGTNSDQNTLRLVQLIHTHGDRTPSQFVHNDPYSIVELFWPEGVGQLTRLGRNRMFRVGRFFNGIYKDFIDFNRNNTNIEKFIKIFSSAYRRSLESASLLATGLIGGMKDNQTLGFFNYLANYWQPIPIKSFLPKATDPLLDVDFPCPNIEKSFHDMWHQDSRIKQLQKENDKFFHEISFYAGETIDTLKQLNLLYQELYIENQYGYNWSKFPYQIWTDNYERYAINRLRELSQLYWTIYYDNRLVQRLIGGELIKEINNNIRRYINQTNQQTKIFIYSTHDGKIVSILQAFGIYNTYLISPGATLVFELHQNESQSTTKKNPWNGYYLKFYYYNETYTDDWAYEMFPETLCLYQKPEMICHLDQYFRHVYHFEPTDILYECGVEVRQLGAKVNLTLMITNGVLLAMLILVINIYAFIKYKKRR